VKVTGESRLGEIVEQVPRAGLVFEVLGINFCCNDQRTLASAATSAGCDPTEVIGLLDRGQLPPQPRLKNDASMTEMTAFIVEVHHRRARRMLIDLRELTGRVISGHATKHPQLFAIRNAVEDIARKLVPHMVTEERYLFPYINTIDKKVPDVSMVVPLFGTVEYPLQSLRHDHGEDLTLINRIREITNNFSPPADACGNFRVLYKMLSEFTGELHEHIELENDTLFPRAIAAEKAAEGR
jgi:regulator of cell morphogenesis and NO signaling